MQTTDRNKIIDRIKKLLALGQSPNEAEATQAMRMAQHLMMLHQIQEGEATIASDALETENITRKTVAHMKTRVKWKGNLYHAIAQTNFCDMYWEDIREINGSSTTRSFNVNLIGTPGNIALVESFYAYLSETITRLAADYIKQQKQLYKTYLKQIEGTGIPAVKTPSWDGEKDKFILGCTHRIAARLREKHKEMQEQGLEAQQGADTETSALMLPVSALVCREAFQRSQSAIAAYKRQVGLRLTTTKSRAFAVNDAYRAGARAGDNVSLNRQVSGASAGSGKALRA